ncbi:MAG: hypothetical protein BWY83_01923 [bacterium ADurb.Bin478]|nr:MAG: hypothetical protein BWY83_01923 [bacterium ADurb.Bin478]
MELLFLSACLPYQIGQSAIAVRPGEKINGRVGSIEQFLFQSAGHAAEHADQQRRAGPVVTDFADARQHTVAGMLAHRAGVHQQNVRFLHVADLLKAVSEQNALDELAVIFIHLTAIGFYIDFHSKRPIIC